MNKNLQAPACLPQTHLDTLCYQRLNAPDFAIPQGRAAKLIRWMKAGAK